MTRTIGQIRGVLFDMDGVVHVGESAIPGAADTLRYLDSKAISYRFLTNTTTRTPEQLATMLSGMGLPVTMEEIMTTHEAAVDHIRKRPGPCYLLVNDNVFHLYKGLPLSESDPEYIVIGDIGDRWNYTLVSEIFRMVRAGADMVALHKGRFWQAEEGLRLDIGVFITGLEYATGKEAVVIGKPSKPFFESAVKSLGMHKDEVIMVGDDIENDVAGAQQAGIPGVLVKTGKYDEADVARSSVKPDAVLDSVADLQEMI